MMRHVALEKTLTYALLPAFAALLLAACGGGQVNTGPLYIDPDGDMGTANGLFFDMPPVDDRLNSNGGDSEDWRYIIVPHSGKLSLTLNVDDPSMEGGWYLHDREGRIIHSEAFDAARGFYELPAMPVEAGTYHFQINAAKGGSVYTVGASYDADPPVVAEVEEEIVDEVVEEPVEKKKRKRTKKKKKKDDKKVEKKKDTDDEDAGGETAGNTKVTGKITLTTELDDGSCDVVIRGVGKANGVSKGMKGTVKGLGKKVKIKSCSARKCEGTVKGVTARDLRSNSSVEFMVK